MLARIYTKKEFSCHIGRSINYTILARMILKINNHDWKIGSVVKSTLAVILGSQVPTPTWQFTIYNSGPENHRLFWPPLPPGMQVVYKHACRKNNHAHNF